MNGKRRNRGIIIDIALLFLCFAVFSSCLASGMLAKYTTGKQADPDNARVATWDITAARAEGETDPTTLVYQSGSFSGDGTFTINITNASEVAARYTVEFSFPENVKDCVQVIHGSDTAPITPDADGKIIVEGSDLVAGNGSATETFTFAVTDAAFGVEGLWTLDPDNTLRMSAADGVNEVSFVALVKFVQID